MKKLLKSKVFWIIAVVVVIVVALAVKAATTEPMVEYVTEKARVGTIVQTVSATGQIKSATEIELNFKNSGALAVLNVKKGDRVVANQIVAQLKANDLAIAVSSAQADLLEAQASLEKIKAGSTPEEIEVARVAVEKAKTDVANSHTDLDNTRLTYQQAIINARGDLVSNMSTALTKARIALQQVNDIVIYKGDPEYFTTSNPNLEIQVQNNYAQALRDIDEAADAHQSAQLTMSDELINSSYITVLEALNAVKDEVDDLGTLLNYVIVNSTITQTVLDGFKTSINSQRTTIDTTIDAYIAYKQAVEDAKVNFQTKVTAAENAITVAERNLASAEASLALKQAGARPEDVTAYQARVNRAYASLRLAQDRYNDTILRAPIDGLITEVNYTIGEQTSGSKPVMKLLGTQTYEIEVDIPESDIAKITEGDGAEITLDAFDDEQIFNGVVATINPAQTEIQDVIYYKVTVAFATEQPETVRALLEKIKPGMTANVDIKTEEIPNVVIIPARAVKEADGQKQVDILQSDKQVTTVVVTTGLRGDDGLIEITSGLQGGEEVITFTRTQ